MESEAVGNTHVWTHTVYDGPRVNIKVEKNSRGVNWEVTVTGASNPDEALRIIRETDAKLAAQYAPPLVTEEKPETKKMGHPAPTEGETR